MADVELVRVCKSFGGVEACKDVDLRIEDGEFVTLLGPSGCGKTTTLNILAGLEEATSGEVRIGGRVVNDLGPFERDVAMVFQNYALYPHMTVAENIGFPLRLRKRPKSEIAERVRAVAETLELSQLLERLPRELSGGQQQRVALGRALIREPAVFLFDEPFSNLDAALRVRLRGEIKELHQRLGVTSVFVTYDQEEAMSISDRVAIMRLAGWSRWARGRLRAPGPPMARFVGSPRWTSCRAPSRALMRARVTGSATLSSRCRAAWPPWLATGPWTWGSGRSTSESARRGRRLRCASSNPSAP
jgi:ABC-type sugar transport system ATPase subunit